MERSANHPLNLRSILVTDTLSGLIAPALMVWFGPVTRETLVANIIGGQVYAHCIGSLAQTSMMWVYPRIYHWHPARRWPLVFLMLAAVTAVGCIFAVVILSLLGYFDLDNAWPHYKRAFRVGFIITLVFGASGILIETMKAQLEWAGVQLRSKELERERALKLATLARLSSLESRIHPHFLFNALNSISSLIREDPDRAERLIEKMAQLLRFSLDANQLGVVTLAQELEIVQGYLEIEKARFGSRLRFSIEAPPDLSQHTLPPLAIQTLVENSVKHTVAPEREGGSISVSASLSSEVLEIRVGDDGSGVDLGALPAGHGLDLLQSRLQTIYEGAAQLRAEGSTIILSVPCSVPISLTTRN